MKKKKVPLRMCIACMEMKPKKDLIRIVKSKNDEVSIDLNGKKSGRGAYICRNIECFKKSFNEKKLEQCLKVKLNKDMYKKLEEEIFKEISTKN